MPLVNRIGGAINLNFRVNAYASLPDSGKENEIAVITETPMTGWVMQAEQPEGVDGLVWIRTGDASMTPFYADKKKQIRLYPVLSRQYINGMWVYKEAYIYRNGAWGKFWNGELYYFGNEFIDITGGWSEYKTCEGTSARNADNITMTYNGTGAGDTIGYYCTNKKYDLREYNTLTINSDWIQALAVGGNSDSCRGYLGAYTSKPTDRGGLQSGAANIMVTKDGGNSVDISNLNDENGYYILVGSHYYKRDDCSSTIKLQTCILSK